MTKKKDEAPKGTPLTPEQVKAEAEAARNHSEHGKVPSK